MDDFYANGDLVVLRPGLPSRNLRFYNERLGTSTEVVVSRHHGERPDLLARRHPSRHVDHAERRPSRACSRADQARGTDLWVLDRATGLRRRVAEHAFVAAWSPDDQRIAFTRTNVGSSELWIAPSAGGEPVRIGNEKTRKFGLTFTPDGQALVYSPTSPPVALRSQPLAANAPATALFDDDAGEEGDAHLLARREVAPLPDLRSGGAGARSCGPGRASTAAPSS